MWNIYLDGSCPKSHLKCAFVSLPLCRWSPSWYQPFTTWCLPSTEAPVQYHIKKMARHLLLEATQVYGLWEIWCDVVDHDRFIILISYSLVMLVFDGLLSYPGCIPSSYYAFHGSRVKVVLETRINCFLKTLNKFSSYLHWSRLKSSTRFSMYPLSRLHCFCGYFSLWLYWYSQRGIHKQC